MSILTFADTHNMIAFLEKPAESDGFHEIINFLNANQICYVLTVNPIIYTSCIQQFWATTKANTVNGERQLQALIDKKKVIITELSIRSDLHLEDVQFLKNWQGWDGGVKFLLSQKKQSRRKQRKDITVTQEETQQDDNVPTPSNDPPLSCEDSMQLSELMILCTNLKKQVLDLEKENDAQAKEISDLKKRIQKLERKKKSRTTGLKRLRKVGMSRRIESSEDTDSLGDHEHASKQGRSIEDIDKDADVSLIDDTQRRSDNKGMIDTNKLHSDEVNVDMPVGEKQEQSPMERENSIRIQPSMIKDKGKAIMIKPKVPLKRKHQVALDEDLERNLQAQFEAELIEERLTRK
ncbi:hypothetical protein Tco_0676528 [Tanacetum coccineum]